MPDNERTYTLDEVKSLLESQRAELSAGLLGQDLLKFGGIGQAQPVGGALGMPGLPQYPTPQGYSGLPGAGQFAPQGVLFAGGSPWPVSAHPANVQNAMIAATAAINTLQKLGLFDKLFGNKQQTTTGNPAGMPAALGGPDTSSEQQF